MFIMKRKNKKIKDKQKKRIEIPFGFFGVYAIQHINNLSKIRKKLKRNKKFKEAEK